MSFLSHVLGRANEEEKKREKSRLANETNVQRNLVFLVTSLFSFGENPKQAPFSLQTSTKRK